jgi:signal transduction histidine kinase
MTVVVEQPEQLQRILRGLTGGTDPGRLLHQTLAAAVQAARGNLGLLLGLVDGVGTPLASTGTVPPLLTEVADAAIASGRLARRSSRDGRRTAVAECLRVGNRVVGALAVAGSPATLDPHQLSLFADCASLALSHRPPPVPTSATEFLEALVRVGSDLDRSSVMNRMLESAETLFGARAGFCAVTDGAAVRISHIRGLDREAVTIASRHPEFRALITSPGLRVDPPTHPVVALLSHGIETAVGLPLQADGRALGHLVLLLGEAPQAALRATLNAFARYASLALRSADVYRRVGDKEEQLAAVVHGMPNPVIVVDQDARFVMVNGAAAELFELAGAFEVGHPAAGRLGNPALEAMLRPDADSSQQLELALGRSEPRVYHAAVRQVASLGGRPLGRVLVLDDVTTEAETHQMKADFVAVIGHELRTPTTVIKGYLHTLINRGDVLDTETRQLALGSIDTNVDRLIRLIEDLLFVSSIDSNRAKLHVEEVDLGELVDTYRSHRVSVRRPRRELEVSVDRAKVDQVLHHLVENALKYSQGEVRIDVANRGDEVHVAVVDRGPGIYSGDVPRLFDRFWQLDGSSTRSHGGTGLGLYICRRLVEAHGGSIWCESRLGVGSSFMFVLPRHPPEPDDVVERTGRPSREPAVGRAGRL